MEFQSKFTCLYLDISQMSKYKPVKDKMRGGDLRGVGEGDKKRQGRKWEEMGNWSKRDAQYTYMKLFKNI